MSGPAGSQGPSAVRHKRAADDPDQCNVRSPERTLWPRSSLDRSMDVAHSSLCRLFARLGFGSNAQPRFGEELGVTVCMSTRSLKELNAERA
jgi:hypothetical protein